MYLTNPQQLIDMCAQLEASNLFMLQANQASQEAAMAAQRTCDDVEAAAAAQLGTLQQQVDMLRGALEQEQAKLAHMVCAGCLLWCVDNTTCCWRDADACKNILNDVVIRQLLMAGVCGRCCTRA